MPCVWSRIFGYLQIIKDERYHLIFLVINSQLKFISNMSGFRILRLYYQTEFICTENSIIRKK